VITDRGDDRFTELGLGDRDAAAARLVLFGRWMCAASEAYPEDIRLLQMIMSQRASMLDAHGGERIFPVAMSLVGKAVAAVEAAQDAGAITPASSLDRALIWAATLGGVLQTDDLEAYAPELFGRARLARQANLDLLAGWGVSPEDLAATVYHALGIDPDLRVPNAEQRPTPVIEGGEPVTALWS